MQMQPGDDDFHSKQRAGSMLCGEHALNNLFGREVFEDTQMKTRLAEIGRSLHGAGRTDNHRYGDLVKLLEVDLDCRVVDVTSFNNIEGRSTEVAARVAEYMLQHPGDFTGIVVQRDNHYVCVKPMDIDRGCLVCNLKQRVYCEVDSMKSKSAAFTLVGKGQLVSIIKRAVEADWAGSQRSVGQLGSFESGLDVESVDISPPVDCVAPGQGGVLFVMNSQLAKSQLERLIMSNSRWAGSQDAILRWTRRLGVPVVVLFCGVGGYSLGVNASGVGWVAMAVDVSKDTCRVHEHLTGVPTVVMDCSGDLEEFTRKLQDALAGFYPGLLLSQCHIHGSPPCRALSSANTTGRTQAGVFGGLNMIVWFLAFVSYARALSSTLETVPPALTYLAPSALRKFGIVQYKLNCRAVCATNQDRWRVWLCDRALDVGKLQPASCRSHAPITTVTSRATAVAVLNGGVRVSTPAEQALQN